MAAVALWADRKLYAVSGSAYGFAGQITLDDRPLTKQQLQDLRLVFMTAALCNDARVSHIDEAEPDLVGDPTEGALLGSGGQRRLNAAEFNLGLSTCRRSAV